MHVLMLSWEYPPRLVGGIARHLYDLANALADQGVKVTVVTAAFGEAAGYEEPRENLRVARTSLGGIWHYDFESEIMHLNFALAAEAIRLAADEPYDVVHSHDWLGGYAGNTVAHALGIPLVSTIHQTEVGRNNGLHSAEQHYINNVEWWLTYQSRRVIVCSDYMHGHLQWAFGLPADKIRVVYNGVDSDRFKVKTDKAFRRRWAADHEKIVFFIGRMVREKGLHVLVEAAPKVLYYHPNTRFVVAGSGDSSWHRARAWQVGAGLSFYFTGFVSDEDLPKLYKVADVATFPSLVEPFGIVALEAMAARTPVVVSDVGGMGSIVRHGENGFKCYPDNPSSLADQILHVLMAPDHAEECAKVALQEARTVYNWKRLAKLTTEVYEEVQ
ncbi:MAG: glycosyltransferase [Armatimonadia bacterium]|nr:glycosyltransferase [Armatimonadia bacterium]